MGRPAIHRLMVFFEKQYINIPRKFSRSQSCRNALTDQLVSQGHPRISFGKGGGRNSLNSLVVDYKEETIIKVQFASRHHNYFNISRANSKSSVSFRGSAAMSAVLLSPEDLERQAHLRTDFVELHFPEPEGQLSLFLVESLGTSLELNTWLICSVVQSRCPSVRKLHQEQSRSCCLLGQMRGREKGRGT